MSITHQIRCHDDLTWRPTGSSSIGDRICLVHCRFDNPAKKTGLDLSYASAFN